MNKSFVKVLKVTDMLGGLTLFIFLLSTGCLTTDQGIHQNTNVNIHVGVAGPGGGEIIEIDFYEVVDNSIVNVLEEISPKLGLTPLARADRSEEFEFRIWTNLDGVGNPKLLGLRKNEKESENNAYFFEINRHPYSIKLRKDHLPVPKSGWNRMLSEFRNRLTTPKGLVRDPNFDLGRDEPVIFLEVLDKGKYRRVLYGQNTSFHDGKRLIEACEYLASEFEVNMDCRG